jgi:copper oxidase (laccase) domain-containing protein
MGPSIKKESYIFTDPTQAADPNWKDFLHKTDKGIGINLPGYITNQCKAAGVLEGNIQVSNVDTAADDNYFSHYRANKTGDKGWDGRFATVVMLP